MLKYTTLWYFGMCLCIWSFCAFTDPWCDYKCHRDVWRMDESLRLDTPSTDAPLPKSPFWWLNWLLPSIVLTVNPHDWVLKVVNASLEWKRKCSLRSYLVNLWPTYGVNFGVRHVWIIGPNKSMVTTDSQFQAYGLLSVLEEGSKIFTTWH